MPGIERRTGVYKVLSGDQENGQWPGPIWAGAANIVATANRAHAMRLVPEEDIFVRTMTLSVTTLDAGDPPAEVAIYNSDCTTKLATSGSVTGKLNALGLAVFTITVPILLRAGTVYYTAYMTSSASAVVQGRTIGPDNGAAAIFGSSPPNLLAGFVNLGAMPLPEPLNIAAGQSIAAPTVRSF